MTTNSSDTQPTERLVVERRSKTYAWFVDNKQQGNWMAYSNDAEPQRLANEHDVEIEYVN